jgi:hypothetical protein
MFSEKQRRNVALKTRLWTIVLLAVTLTAATTTVVNAAAVGPPTGLVATAGNNQVSLTWTAPSVGGNPAILDYIVDYTSDGSTWSNFIHEVSTTASSTVTSLINNVQYSFRIYAVNADGTGAASNVAIGTPVSNHTPNDLATYKACPTGVAPAAAFTDVVSTDVDCVKYYGITKGTTETTYSPISPVTRWQMALFLTRMASRTGITLGDGTGHGFTDISGESSEIQTAIGQIKQLGITVGKTATTYAPADNVSREEMALFLTRLLKKSTVGPGGNTEYVTGTSGAKEIKSNDTDHNFTDLSGVTLYASLTAITNLWNLGVTEVATATLYEPQEPMTRKAMATMMTNALAHSNARPKGLVIQTGSYRVEGTPRITLSVTHRSDAFAPIADTVVDTFKYIHTIDTTSTRFTTTGFCSSTAVTEAGSTKCTIDTGDPKTDANGNLAAFGSETPALTSLDFWAWTAAVGTIYDNDVHASGASKITVVMTTTSS